MSDKTILYTVVAIVVSHFIFAIVYLFWKILSAPRKKHQEGTEEENKNSQ